MCLLGYYFMLSCLQKLKQVDFSHNPYAESTFVWHDKRLLDLVQSEDECAQEFFRLLALCHTVMSEEKDGKTAVMLDLNMNCYCLHLNIECF